MNLPPGVFLVSNCMKEPGHSVFAEIVQPTCAREKQWRTIIDAGANHRRCHIFKSPSDYLSMSFSVPNPLARN